MNFKQEVFDHCMLLLNERIERAKAAMAAAQEAANGEDKSSAGDKYETSRAMEHLDRDMNAKQMAEAMKERQALSMINPNMSSDKVITGSLVEAAGAVYFIGAGIGQIRIGEKNVVVLSPLAPLTKLMTGKKENEDFVFNGRTIRILKIS